MILFLMFVFGQFFLASVLVAIYGMKRKSIKMVFFPIACFIVISILFYEALLFFITSM